MERFDNLSHEDPNNIPPLPLTFSLQLHSDNCTYHLYFANQDATCRCTNRPTELPGQPLNQQREM